MANAALAQLFAVSVTAVPASPRKPSSGDVLRHLRERGMPFTVLHVADLRGSTRAAAREMLLRWERRGLVQVSRTGHRKLTQWEFVA